MGQEADAQRRTRASTWPPGCNNGTVYISTVPGNAKGFYQGNGQAILWALNSKSGAAQWKWEEVPKDLWLKAHTNINSGGGQWYPPSFDAKGDVYLGVANPAPPRCQGLPLGSRPGPDLYTDSIVKLDHTTGKLQWYYQLTPHDINDWDLQNSPILTTANGKRVVIDGGKAGIVVAVDQNTGKLLWKTPVGTHNGHDHDGLLTPAQPKAKLKFPYESTRILGGVESQLASDGTNVYAAVNNLASTYTNNTQGRHQIQDALQQGHRESSPLDQATGKIAWDHKFNQSPYGAASLTNDVALHDDVRRHTSGRSHEDRQDLWSAKLPAGTNTPVAIAGDTYHRRLVPAGQGSEGRHRRLPAPVLMSLPGGGSAQSRCSAD